MNERPTLGKIKRRSRKPSNLRESSVRRFFFDAENPLPLVFQAEYPGMDLGVWLRENQSRVRRELEQYGAVLFRNFAIANSAEFNEAVKGWQAPLLEYNFGSTPRTNLKSGIYTSTEYPADQEIVMHNEVAYSKSYPSYLWFYCNIAAEEGGCTPLADSRKIYEMLDPELVAEFEARKIIYCRNYVEGIDVPWRSVFRTDSKEGVAEYCERNDIEYEWVSEEHLRTKELCEAVIKHPSTGEKVWFNQAHLFHPSNLSEELAAQLATIPEENLPRNVYWGDGGSIDPALLQKVRDAYIKAKVRFPWQVGDMLLVDNVLASHGRDSYRGKRKILVSMQGPLAVTADV